MATETTNYKLIKDGPNEYYDIEKLNANLDKIDESIYSKVEKVAGKDLSANDYSDAEKAEVAKVKNKAEKSVVDAHLADDAPHQYGNRFEWRYNETEDSLDLVVIE